MSEYRLVITRSVQNAHYAEEYAQWERQRSFAIQTFPGDGAPARTIEQEVLDVSVSAETFAAIRKAALETL